jgi:hypothetical protein
MLLLLYCLQHLWQILDEAIADAKEESWRENEETKKEI